KLALGFGRLHIDDIAGTNDLADFPYGPSADLGPLHALDRQYSDRAFLTHKSTRFTTRLQPDTSRLVTDLKHDGQPPRGHIGQGLHIDKFDTPVAGDVDLGDRTAPALGFVVTHQAVSEYFARQYLQFGIERRTDGETALVKLLFAVTLVELASHFLGEIFGSEDVRAGRL